MQPLTNIGTQYHKKIAAALAVATMLSFAGPVLASSHREAPLISGDPKVDATDVYAFISPDSPNSVTLIANYLPFEEPAGGPNFYAFDNNALYEIKVDNDGDANPDISYQFRFKSTITNPNTFLYNTGPITSLTDSTFNIRQTYTLSRVENGQTTVLATDVPVPPVNVGPKSTPNYAALQAQAIKTLPNGIKTFAGQSDDPFYAELGGLFDLLTIRNLPGNAGGGIDGLKGYNVQSLALQIPISQLTSTKTHPTDVADPKAVIGVWTTASRHGTSVITANPNGNTFSNDWVQVSRLGAPLVNEVVVPLGAKDLWNGSKPADDAQFANGVTDPELAKLLKALYGINVPPQGAFGSANQRDDLIAIFLTGIPGLTKSEEATPSEQLRLNVAVAPSANPNVMGVLGGDNQGYPNGRRLADDVVDISLKAVAGAAYPLFHPTFVADATGVKLGDGVDANDVAFRTTFPYLAIPNRGFESIPHGNAASPVVTPPPTPPTGTTTPPVGTTTPPTQGYGSISGVVYNDANKNFERDGGESGIAGFMVKLYQGALYFGTLVASKTTDAAGNYSFANLPDGTYSVEQVPMNGYSQGTPDYSSVSVVGGVGQSTIDFANATGKKAKFDRVKQHNKNVLKHDNRNRNRN